MPKHGLLVILILVTTLMFVWVERVEMQKLQATIIGLQAENDILDITLKDEQSKFKSTIERMEKEINKYVLDKTSYEYKIATLTEAIDTKTEEEESKINQELKTDSSSDNQLRLVRNMLYEFASKK